MAVFICQACGAEHSAEDGKCPECGATQTIRLKAVTDRMVDRVIKGKYKIIRKLGQGGMGAVYLAEQMGIGHRVALKFLKSEFSSDAEIARRFLNEAKSYARVAHPNAVTLHDFGQDEEGNLFIAMEYCEGVDLKKVISEQKQLPVAEAIEVVLQVADVLANAHSKGVVHRDLKPENIMIRRGMRGVHAKVLDFGIARLMDAGTRLTVAGAIAGTPRYMSPEQVEGREADLRCDIYSLGIVLYETLTGVQPFDGNTIAEILRRQVTEAMPRLSEASPDLDFAELDAVIQKATAKKREERWPDMLTFADALSQAMPTQSQMAIPALQRSGFSRVNATPAPGAATSSSGVPVTELEMSGATMLKTSPTPAVLAPPSAPRPAPSVSKPVLSTMAAGFGTELEGRSSQLMNEVAQVAPKSNVGFIAAAIVGVLAIAGGVVFVLRASSATEVAPASAIAQVVDAGVPVAATNTDNQVAMAATQMVREEFALGKLGAGRDAFEVAKLDEAETYLKTVGQDTPSAPAAAELLAKIKRIRERLGIANSYRARGDCPSALSVYNEVLRLNARVSEAVDGANKCKAGMVDTTMDP